MTERQIEGCDYATDQKEYIKDSQILGMVTNFEKQFDNILDRDA